MSGTTIGIKLDDETRARLEKLGEVKKRSRHWLMREAIARFLDSEERYEREKAEDQERWERYLDTHIYVPHEEMSARLEELAAHAARAAKTE